jgi:hypothetical protein
LFSGTLVTPGKTKNDNIPLQGSKEFIVTPLASKTSDFSDDNIFTPATLSQIDQSLHEYKSRNDGNNKNNLEGTVIDCPKTPTSLSTIHNPYATKSMKKNNNTMKSPSFIDTTTFGLVWDAEAANNAPSDHGLLRCAYINGSNQQTVIFWFEQTGPKGYYIQHFISEAMKAQKKWVCGPPFPFGALVNDPHYILNWHIKGEKVPVGLDGKYGIRLFHYTHPGKQSRMELTDMAYALKNTLLTVNFKIGVTIDKNKLFMYDDSCVWRNLISESDCFEKLHRELNISNFNPSIWETHRQVLAKYFFPGKLTFEQGKKLYAPIEEYHPNYKRTPKFILDVEEHIASAKLPLHVGANINPMDDFIDTGNLPSEFNDEIDKPL